MSSERQEYNEISPWWGEHIHRYFEGCKLITNNDCVLDLACGNGFGTHLISQATKGQVIGADIDDVSVLDCQTKFQKSNLRYQVEDGTNLTFEANSFDMIFSFETIEHTTKYKEMVSEFRRCLKDSGTLILSTPNILVNSPDGLVKNPYHTQEFNLLELKELLNSVFGNVKIYGQQYIRYEHKSFINKIAKLIESFFYLKGVRKLPTFIQDTTMKLLIGKTQYPEISDFKMTSNPDEILKCKTFFAVCKK